MSPSAPEETRDMGDKRVGPGRSINTGRFSGRFVYTEADASVSVDGDQYKTFLVNRVSDDRYLGFVRHQLGTSWWFAQPRDLTESLPGHQSRREWAADELDANSRQHEWCACGVSVAKHDRPTRAAMRAWAAASDPNRDIGAARDAVTYQAAFHARFRGRHYDLTTCVKHAKAYGSPIADMHLELIVPGQAPRHRVLVGPENIIGGYWVRHWIGGALGETYQYPDPDTTLEHIRDAYLSRGYREVHDWRK